MSDSIEYASQTTSPSPRLSKLAVMTLLVSLLACPFLTGFIGHKLEEINFVGFGVARPAVLALLMLSLILAVFALIRIRTSHGQLRGSDLAYYALALSVLWIALSFAIYFALRNAKFGPGD